MERLTKIVMAWELHRQGVPTVRISADVGVHRETVGLWLKGIRTHGLDEFLRRYEQAKKRPRRRQRTSAAIKALVFEIRQREFHCCGQKIAWFLRKEHGIELSVSHIYSILGERYQLREKVHKNVARGPVPQAAKPRQVVQMDTVHFGDVFAFTSVDICSREADVMLALSVTSEQGEAFLHHTMQRRYGGHVDLIQTDGGPEFKGRFLSAVGGYCQRHRFARPYKKNEQAHIESFNRTVRKECLGWTKYKPAGLPDLVPVVEQFLDRYHHHRPHLAFNPMNPPVTL